LAGSERKSRKKWPSRFYSTDKHENLREIRVRKPKIPPATLACSSNPPAERIFNYVYGKGGGWLVLRPDKSCEGSGSFWIRFFLPRPTKNSPGNLGFSFSYRRLHRSIKLPKGKRQTANVCWASKLPMLPASKSGWWLKRWRWGNCLVHNWDKIASAEIQDMSCISHTRERRPTNQNQITSNSHPRLAGK